MNNLKIYLAGAMNGLTYNEMNDWRVLTRVKILECAEKCDYNVKVVNPVDYFNFKEKRYQSESEVMKFDLNKVRECNLIIVNIDKINTSIGTAIELYEASKLDIPIIAYNKCGENDYSKVHPWLRCCITRVQNSVTDIVDYIKDFYMN